MGARGIVLMVAVVLAGGCSASGEGLSPVPDPVAASYSALPPATDCGTTTLTSPGAPRLLPDGAVGCVRQALAAGRTVTVALSAPTTEGDPIVDHHRVSASGDVEVWSDASKDRYGPGTWSHRSVPCPGEKGTVVAQLCAVRG